MTTRRQPDSTPSRFARDTEVRRVDDVTFVATIDPGWWIVRGPNGGYIAAILLRALQIIIGADHPPRSLTVHYLAPPVEGECTLRVEVDRRGRSMVFAHAALEQAGSVRAVARLAASPAFEIPLSFSTLAPPHYEPPAWDHERPPAPIPMAARYETEWREGDDATAGDGIARVGGWIRFAPEEGNQSFDAPAVAAITDAWSPAIFHKVPITDRGPAIAVPTIDLTVHFRTQVPEGTGALAVRFTTTTLTDGFLEEDGELWTPDGRLVAQSRQLGVALSR